MKPAMILYRLGALGLVLESIYLFHVTRQDNPLAWWGTIILFGFPVLGGLLLLSVRSVQLTSGDSRLMILAHGAALISVFWIILWCFVWLFFSSRMQDPEMIIKHTAYLHLFGVSFTMAGYATGWMNPRLGERSVRFLMTVGWASSYVAWANMYFLPDAKWLWFPAVGGLLVVLGAFLIQRSLKRAVEMKTPLS